MKLLADVMLGSLARHLRMCGHDTVYALDRGVEGDDALLALAGGEGRRLLTRDVELAERADDGVLLRARDVEGQLAELRGAGFDLSLTRPSRCGRCNGPLELVEGKAATPDYAPDPSEERVWRCVACGQHFWRGSHWADVEERLTGL